jgi:serine/threonine-protein kinase RsbW
MTAPLKLTVRRSDAAPAAGEAVEVSVRVPSEVFVIEEAVELISRHCLAGFPSSQRFHFRLRVALSEALANAIVFGNGEDPAKTVDVRVECVMEHVRLYVTDQGSGFDPTGVAPPVAPQHLEQSRGRGLFLINQLADHVRFNERGNSICMTLRRH